MVRCIPTAATSRFSLLLVGYVVAVKTTVGCDSVTAVIKIIIEVQKIWYMSIRAFKLGSFACWSFQNEAVLFPVLLHLHVVLDPEL